MVWVSPAEESGVSESPKSAKDKSLRSLFWLQLKVEYLARATRISAGVEFAPVAEMEVSEAKTPNSPRSYWPDPAGFSQLAALGHRASLLTWGPIGISAKG
jgi:hypothetical protein